MRVSKTKTIQVRVTAAEYTKLRREARAVRQTISARVRARLHESMAPDIYCEKAPRADDQPRGWMPTWTTREGGGHEENSDRRDDAESGRL